jgi:hypothetical protein
VNDFIAVYDASDDNPEYNLQISIAKVLEINHATSELHVWWMYGTSWTGTWYEWKFRKTKKAYTQWIESSSVIVVNRKWLKIILTQKSGHAPHNSTYYIEKESIEDIIKLLA